MMFFFGFAMTNWVSIKIHFTIFLVTTEILFHYNYTIQYVPWKPVTIIPCSFYLRKCPKNLHSGTYDTIRLRIMLNFVTLVQILY